MPFLLLKKAGGEEGPAQKREVQTINSESSRDEAARQGTLQRGNALFSEHLLQTDNCWGFRAINSAPSTSIKVQPIKGSNTRVSCGSAPQKEDSSGHICSMVQNLFTSNSSPNEELQLAMTSPFFCSAISTLLPLHSHTIFKETAQCFSGKWESLSQQHFAACRLYILAQRKEIIKDTKRWPPRERNEVGVAVSQGAARQPFCNVLLQPLPFFP